MQRFLALEQVSVVLASCQPFFRRTCLVMTARILPKPNVHIYTVGLPSGGLLLPGIVRLGVRCLF